MSGQHQAQPSQQSQEAQWRKWRSVADLYHAYFTGLILTVVTRRGTSDAAEFVFRVFRRQQQERFLPGLEKLGLSKLPPAVAAAQYHYLSNWIGGVHVEYMYESDRKAWIRYPPPRWIWRGTAICGIPGEVSRAMLRGWHANNGVTLGHPNMGFVCTKQSVDGQDGLEGYYCEYDHPLEPDQRLVFARHLEAPLFDAAKAPALPVASWPRPRLEKAYRNYAMEYVRTAAPAMVQLFGPEDAGYLLHLTGKLIGMQYFDEISAGLSTDRGDTKDFATFLGALFEAQEDVADIGETGGGFEIRQQTWKLMADVADYHPACAKVLEELFEGLAAGCRRHIAVHRHRRRLSGRSGDQKVQASTSSARRRPMRLMQVATGCAVLGTEQHGGQIVLVWERKCPISLSPNSFRVFPPATANNR